MEVVGGLWEKSASRLGKAEWLLGRGRRSRKHCRSAAVCVNTLDQISTDRVELWSLTNASLRAGGCGLTLTGEDSVDVEPGSAGASFTYYRRGNF